MCAMQRRGGAIRRQLVGALQGCHLSAPGRGPAKPAGAPRGCGGRATPRIARTRLDALLEAEVTHFAEAMQAHPLTLQQVLAYSDADELRKFLSLELPIRFAKRLKLVESLPNWSVYPHLRTSRSLCSDAFRRLRNVSPADGASRFRDVLRDVKRRNTNVLRHVARGTFELKRHEPVSQKKVNKFLDDFLLSRIGNEILTSQYLALTEPTGAASVIDSAGDPVALIQRAADEASSLCRHQYKRAPPVDISTVGHICFPFIPQVLHYILFEMLKNSLRAVTERHGERCDQHPVRVLVTGDDLTVVVRVSDQGGGVHLDELDNIWSYLYTTAREKSHVNDEVEQEEETPMAGFGCGLPLSRAYARYVGGRLELNTLPHHGMNAYLYLSRIGNVEEAFYSSAFSSACPP